MRSDGSHETVERHMKKWANHGRKMDRFQSVTKEEGDVFARMLEENLCNLDSEVSVIKSNNCTDAYHIKQCCGAEIIYFRLRLRLWP